MKQIDELNLPEDCRYTQNYDWARAEGDRVRARGFAVMEPQQLAFKWDRFSCSKGEACGKGGSVCQVIVASKRTEQIKTILMKEVVQRESS